MRSYVQGIREPLVARLQELNPQSIAVNHSTDDAISDGLSHGMFLLLDKYLSDTPYAKRIRPATDVVEALRGRENPAEIERIRQANRETENIIRSVESVARIGAVEQEIATFMKVEAARKGYGLAREPQMCPIVNTGPDSMIGQGIPSSLALASGHVLHIDFGISRDEYCSDLQRCWYVPRDGESEPPLEVGQAFDTVVKAIQSAAAALKPGVAGWEVDALARKIVVDAGYPGYHHATGHQVGRAEHDGGGVLGPGWERYGQPPYRPAESDNVFTIELGIESFGECRYIGLEEMVLVTNDGCEFLSEPQTALPLLQSV